MEDRAVVVMKHSQPYVLRPRSSSLLRPSPFPSRWSSSRLHGRRRHQSGRHRVESLSLTVSFLGKGTSTTMGLVLQYFVLYFYNEITHGQKK